MPNPAAVTPTQDLSLEGIEEATVTGPDGVTGRFQNLVLHSHFQPIISLVHHRVVGYEGLVRPRDSGGQPVAPDVLFDTLESDDDIVFLDRLARNIHVRNFADAGLDQPWLFLNVNARVAMCGNEHGPISRPCSHAMAWHRTGS